MLTNSGTIVAGNGGYSHFGHGGAGGAGVFVSGGTVVTSGTIAGGAGGYGSYGSGAAGDAVQFGSVAGTLVIDPGAVFTGDIVANTAVRDTLVLAGHAAGTLSGFGSAITGITDIVADTHAHWLLKGSVSGSGSLLLDAGARVTIEGPLSIASIAFASGGETLCLDTTAKIGSVFSGFGTCDIIDLQNLQASSITYHNGTLKLFDAGGLLVQKLEVAGQYNQADFALKSDGHGGTDVIYAGSDAVSLLGRTAGFSGVMELVDHHAMAMLGGMHWL